MLNKFTTGRASINRFMVTVLHVMSLVDNQIITRIMGGLLTVSMMVGICFGKNVPANFVFGDSLVEAGNNNYIPTLSRANIIPNGIDFGMPTGRFTNGRTIADIIGKYCTGTLISLLCATPINYRL